MTRPTRREARRRWELLAAGVPTGENPELRAWLQQVARDMLDADLVGTTTAAQRNQRAAAFTAASGLAGKKRATDGGEVTTWLRAYQVAHQRGDASVRGMGAVQFVADALGWTADPASSADPARRIRAALADLAEPDRTVFLAILKTRPIL